MGFTGTDAKYAPIDTASSGDNTLVAAVSGKKVRVLALFVVASGGANTLRLESSAGGTALTGQMDLADGDQLVLPMNPEGWMETVAGELLNLELSVAKSVDGALVYVEV